MNESRSFTGAVLALLVMASMPSRIAANCETGAYLIHTVAEYAQLNHSRQWILRIETKDWIRSAFLDEHDLLLLPVAAETTYVLHRLYNLLVSDEADTFRIGDGTGVTCRPDLSKIRLVEPQGVMSGLALVLRPCIDVPADARYLIYDRDRRLLWAPAALPIDDVTPESSPSTVEPAMREQMIGLGAGGDSIREEDVASVRSRHLRIGHGERALGVTVAVARLRNLGRLLGGEGKGLHVGGGYWSRDEVEGKLADFPVIFFRHGDGPPHYVADGSWCGGYRLGMERDTTTPSDRSPEPKLLGAFERFVFDGAWDTDGDESPDLILVNDSFLYQIGTRPDDLWVVDYSQGC